MEEFQKKDNDIDVFLLSTRAVRHTLLILFLHNQIPVSDINMSFIHVNCILICSNSTSFFSLDARGEPCPLYTSSPQPFSLSVVMRAAAPLCAAGAVPALSLWGKVSLGGKLIIKSLCLTLTRPFLT